MYRPELPCACCWKTSAGRKNIARKSDCPISRNGSHTDNRKRWDGFLLPGIEKTTETFHFGGFTLAEKEGFEPSRHFRALLPSQGGPFTTWVLLQRLTGLTKKCGGEGGIRTHAPFRTNGFQDRLVMTTSIPLRIESLALSKKYYSIRLFFCQPLFSGNFSS